MPWDPTLTELQNVLANLYPRDADVRNFLDAVGMDDARIAFDARAVNTWHAVLDEAGKQGKIEEVLRQAERAYPTHAPLATAVAACRRRYGGGVVGGGAVSGGSSSGGAGVASGPRQWRLLPTQKRILVDALLQCPTVADGSSRDAVVNELPDRIRHNAQRNSNTRVDVGNLLNAALNYAGGLEELIEAVRFHEGDSFAMGEVDRVLAELAGSGG